MRYARLPLSARLAIILLLAALTALQAIRSAFVIAYADVAPAKAATLWADHPDVLISGALTAIGAAAASGEAPPETALGALASAAAVAPLSSEPFLARGIQADQAGDAALAGRAFVAAKRRAPREAAPRFLLAEQYLSAGEATRGLAELAALARLLPNGAQSVAPALASYARGTNDARALKQAFKANPTLEQTVLLELAKDGETASLAISLASGLRDPSGAPHGWVKRLLNSLVASGNFERARQLWERASATRPSIGIFDPAFRGSQAPPPFNWTFISDSRGYAEPDGRGGLRVAFYGRENTVLASQTLVLGPGRYRLSAAIDGDAGGMLTWTISCLPGNTKAGRATPGSSAEFLIGTGCPAQRLDLIGDAPELPEQVEVTIRDLRLVRTGDGG